MFDICEIMGLCVTTRVSFKRPTVIGKKLFDFDLAICSGKKFRSLNYEYYVTLPMILTAFRFR